MFLEQPVRVLSNGRSLFGVLHAPERGTSDVAVLFLNAGLQNRVGPQRIYVEAARAFSQRGFLSLRIDLPGVGDSEGPLPTLHFDCFDPADIDGAIGFLTDEHGAKKLVVLGMCAGARVGLKAAYQDPRVDSVVAWSVPIVSGPPNMPASPGAVMSSVAARGFLRHWGPKLFSYSAWRDYLDSGQTFRAALGSFWRVVKGALPERLVGRSTHQMDFLAALDGWIDSPRRILFAYGENDSTPLSEFRDRYSEVAAGRGGVREFIVVPDAGHTFTSTASQKTLIEQTGEWLERHYGPAGHRA
jgi:pimeloyl-ACP methyl ester carboxylesterase